MPVNVLQAMLPVVNDMPEHDLWFWGRLSVSRHGLVTVRSSEYQDRVERFKHGKLHGVQEGPRRRRRVAYKTQYRNGKVHGFHRTYYSNGRLASEQWYKMGQLVKNTVLNGKELDSGGDS